MFGGFIIYRLSRLFNLIKENKMAKVIYEGSLPDDHEIYKRGSVVITGYNINPSPKKKSKKKENSKKSQENQRKESPYRRLMRSTAPGISEEKLDFLEQIS